MIRYQSFFEQSGIHTILITAIHPKMLWSIEKTVKDCTINTIICFPSRRIDHIIFWLIAERSMAIEINHNLV